MLYQITSAYFQDDHADALRYDPAITAAVGKDVLASQPTLSRFHNRLDENTLAQLEEIQRILRSRVYSVEKPDHVLMDQDSTLLSTYGHQEIVPLFGALPVRICPDCAAAAILRRSGTKAAVYIREWKADITENDRKPLRRLRPYPSKR